MTRLFLKLYLAVSLAVILSSATTGWIFWSSWQPESNAHLSRLVSPALLAIASELKSVASSPGAQAMSAPYPDSWVDKLGVPGLKAPSGAQFNLLKRFADETTWQLALMPEGLVGLSEPERARLKRGEVIYKVLSKGRLAYVQLGEGELLEATLFSTNTPLKQILSGFHFLTARRADPEHPFIGIQDRLLDGEEVITIPLASSALSQLELVRLLHGPRTAARLVGTSHRVQMIAFDQQGRAALKQLDLELSLPIFPPTLLIPLAVLLIGVALWLTLSPLKRKLSRLAEVTERFGQGELSARVALEGRGPLESISRGFDNSADRIEALIQSHESLLQAVSHELRTPISRLYLYNDLLVDEERSEERVSLGHQVHLTLEELRSLTTELLDFNRLSAGETELKTERCELSQLVARARCQAQPLTKELLTEQGGCSTVERWIIGEERLLTRALLNLIKNADRHAHQQVRLACGSVADGAESWVWLSVEDDGQGVEPQDRERIFEPFVRLEQSRSRAEGGAGLGLSIVQSVVKAHQGRLTLDESPLGGARFTIYFKPLELTELTALAEPEGHELELG